MTAEGSSNIYAHLLKEQGSCVVTVEGVDWYDYGGFMIPAYLPHCCPEISSKMAKDVIMICKKPFVRWDSKFGEVERSQWWYVIRRGAWSLSQCSGNTRSKIRRGRKRLHARLCTPDEILEKGYEVCGKAARRYGRHEFLPSKEAFAKKVEAALSVDGVLEFFGVFYGENLVGCSENYIQDNAVFWESIWHDPDFLGKYSSYVLIDAMLNHYLNDKKFMYVLDGWRSIYHKTQIQDHLIRAFGFTKEYAIVHMVYSKKFGMAVKAAYPFRHFLWVLSDRLTNNILNKTGAMLRQEYIRRACMNL